MTQEQSNWPALWDRDGFINAVPILEAEKALSHRQHLEQTESRLGRNLHYHHKIHCLLPSAYELATHPAVLDVVSSLIGPDILLYNTTFIIKEPNTGGHVSWHQDLTYWGFDGDEQVSMWLALSPANEASGCMRMLPGSHKQGVKDHQATEDEQNILLQGQTVLDVSEEAAVLCELQPGEASFHHGWTLHASAPNHSDDRRIGLNVQYIVPRLKQLKSDQDTALLIKGEDRYQHFLPDTPATAEPDEAALLMHDALEEKYRSIAGS